MTEEINSSPVNVLEPAGFWIRAGARLLDWVVLGVGSFFSALLLMIVAGVLEAATGRPAAQMLDSLQKTTFIGWIGNVLIPLLYHSLFEGVAGTTAGKRMLGLHIVTMEGKPIGFMQGVRRSLGFLVDALFFGAIAWGEMKDSPEKQRIGDRWANTRVVRRRTVRPEALPPTMLFVAAFISAAEVAFLATIATQVLEYLWQTRGA